MFLNNPMVHVRFANARVPRLYPAISLGEITVVTRHPPVCFNKTTGRQSIRDSHRLNRILQPSKTTRNTLITIVFQQVNAPSGHTAVGTQLAY